MNRIKLVLTTALLLLLCATMHAQFGVRLGKAIENAAQNAAVRKAEQKTDEAVSKGIDKATDPNSYKGEGNNNNNKNSNNNNGSSGKNNNGSSEEENGNTTSGGKSNAVAPQGAKAAEMAYAKSDFVPGDEIIFDDPMDNEQLGEFPSQWDLLSGTSEVAMANGKKGMELTRNVDAVVPLMKNPYNYLGDIFTVEFDFLNVKRERDGTSLWLAISFFAPTKNGELLMQFSKCLNLNDQRYGYGWSSSTQNSQGSGDVNLAYDMWHHVAISFNKRAWKLYINGVRIINVPNVKTPPGWLKINLDNVGETNCLITNFRIAKGAVPLYDRLMSEGKIISYGITFDVGKSTIKPESMGEINRIVKLMQDNPDLKFSVEGHTDSTGGAASNQTLSEARSKAVMDKLVELGISKDRLKSAGKGQTSPIADNSTDEGRAKNRRVEFVKQ